MYIVISLMYLKTQQVGVYCPIPKESSRIIEMRLPFPCNNFD